MASSSFNSRRLANIKASDRRFLAEMRQLAERVGQQVQRFAVGATASERVVPNRRATRERLSRAVWEQVVRPYFIGSGDEPYTTPAPSPSPTSPPSPLSNEWRGGIPRANSAFARLIFEGVEAAVAVEVDRQIRIIENNADPKIKDWLTGSRPIGEERGDPWYDPFHMFVYKNRTGQPYVLSDAVWDAAEGMRNTIDRFLAYHIANGTAAVDIAELFIPYLTTGARNIQTATPYGTVGNYAARRLARTEITAASGRAYINAALVNPYIKGTKWNLSPSHPEPDICDSYASRNGGVYETSSLPPYPAHPHCLCYLTPVLANRREVNGELRANLEYLEREIGLTSSEARRIRQDINSRLGQVLRLQGAFNRGWMHPALAYGDFVDRLLRRITG